MTKEHPEEKTDSAWKVEYDEFAVVSLARDRGWLTEAQALACLREDEAGRSVTMFLKHRGWLDEARIAELDRLCQEQLEQELDLIEGTIPQDRIIAQRYRLAGLIGRGGASRVYRALDLQMNRWVAVKIVSSDAPSALERFRREVRIAARLQHPNIGRVHDVVEQQNSSVIIMELIEGTTLGQVELSLNQAVQAMISVCRAVEYAHSCGVIHRDLKPDNLMIDSRGHVFVLDFGLAKDPVEQRISVSGSILGTPAYMSPEQAQGKIGAIGVRSDVYSLGATLYTLSTGKAPFSGATAIETIHRAIHEDPVHPRRRKVSLPLDLCTIILHAMSKEPERRYPEVADFREDLERFLRGDPIRARAPSVRYRVARAIKRYRTASLFLSTMVVLLIGAGIYHFVSTMLVRAELDAYLRIAKEHESTGAWMEALAVYEQALALAPRDSEFQVRTEALRRDLSVRISNLSVQVGLFLPAENRLTSLRKNVYRPDYRLTETELKDYAALETEIANEMKRTQPSAQGYFLMGRVRHLLSDTSRARTLYEKGLEIEPTHSGCLLFKSWLLIDEALIEFFKPAEERGGDTYPLASAKAKEALALFKRAEESNPKGVSELDLDLLKGYVLIVKGKSTVDYATRMLKKWEGKDFAEEFYFIRSFGQHPVESVADLDRAISAMRSHATAFFWRGVMRGCLRQYPEAVRDLNLATEINPCLRDAYVNSVLYRMLMKDYVGAIGDLNRQIAVWPDMALAYINRGKVYLTVGDFERALADSDQAVRLDPRLPGAYSMRSRARAARGDVEGALSDLETSLGIDPRHADSLLARGAIYAGKGEHRRAIEDFSLAVEIAPRNWRALQSRAEALFKIGKCEEAILDCDLALVIEPSNSAVLLLRAVISSRQNRFESALRDCKSAIELDPSKIEARMTYAMLLYRRLELNPQAPSSEWADAASQIEEALRNVPEGSPSRTRLKTMLDDIRSRLEVREREY